MIMAEEKNKIGTIKEDEYHPLADSALAYVKARRVSDQMSIEAIFSTALSGNRAAEICASTLQRIQDGKPVSDRYVLGLAWMLKEMEELK